MHTTYRRGGLAGLGTGWKVHRLMAVGVFAFLLAMPVTPEAVTATNSEFGTVDGNSFTRTFDISGADAITDVEILIDFSKCDNPAPSPTDAGCLATGFSFNSEIVFQLTSPSSTITVNLVSAGDSETQIPGTYTGQTPGTRVSVTFDDQATTVVGGSLLQFGRFQPAGRLAAFNGQDPNGTWTLTVQDTGAGDPLQFYSATLCINETCPSISQLIGDIDANGDLDTVDAGLVLEVLVGRNPPAAIHFLSSGDMNADGFIDNRDSSLILAVAAGKVLPPPEPSRIQAFDTGEGIVVTGIPDAVLPNSTVNLRNTTNGATASVPAANDGSFEGELDVGLDGVVVDTIVVDISDINGNGSPARAAILVQQGDGGGGRAQLRRVQP